MLQHAIAVLLLYLERCRQGVEVELLLPGEPLDPDDYSQILDPAAERAALKKRVRQLKKGELQSLLLGLLDESPEICVLIDRKLQTPPENSQQLERRIAKVRKEIEKVSEEPGWQNYWDGRGCTPDYSHVRNLRIPVKSATHSRRIRPPVPEQNGHPSERSDAGVFFLL